MLNKVHLVLALIVLLGLVLSISPITIYNIHSNILGKLMLVVFVIYSSTVSVTLGCLAALLFVIISQKTQNQFEGMENATATTAATPTPTTAQTDTIAALKEKAASAGIDLDAVKSSLASKASNSIAVTPTPSTGDVAPTTTESFKSGWAPANV